ncbi:MAG: hypothetical protein SGI72_02565 [Planctomycetota bacterium]|nr:hypothetical protein [Planctomycetota bacterium]
MNTRFLLIGLALASITFVSACSSGGDDDDTTNFQGFVQNLATTPVDDADPVSIDALDFEISEDPNQFDALFQ